MIAILLGVLAAQAAANTDSGVTSLNGRCEYPPAVARYQRETLLVLCDSLVIDRGDETATFDFNRRSWGPMLRFVGVMSGERMAISSVRLRSGNSIAATGTCEIFHSGGKLTVVSCLARAGSKSYAANFRPSRP